MHLIKNGLHMNRYRSGKIYTFNKKDATKKRLGSNQTSLSYKQYKDSGEINPTRDSWAK